MPYSPGNEAGTERRRLPRSTSSPWGGVDRGPLPCHLLEPWLSAPQVIVHGNGFPFLCSIVLFAVTAECFCMCNYPSLHISEGTLRCRLPAFDSRHAALSPCV